MMLSFLVIVLLVLGQTEVIQATFLTQSLKPETVAADDRIKMHGDKTKRALKDHFEDSHCLQNFEISAKTIIRTEESNQNGGVFLNSSVSESFDLCLQSCCETSLCSVAVWDKEHNDCYLFDCGPSTPEEFRCRFTSDLAFTSAALLLNRQQFDANRWTYQTQHQRSLQDLVGERASELEDTIRKLEAVQEQNAPACGQYEFTCQSGDCIAVYDVCNGIFQCQDGSDEDPQMCPATSTRSPGTVAPPRQSTMLYPVRPANINLWGREGEKFRPQPPAATQMSSTSAPVNSPFLHRQPALQLPALQAPNLQQQQQQQPQLELAYNGIYAPQFPQFHQAFQYYPGANSGYRLAPAGGMGNSNQQYNLPPNYAQTQGVTVVTSKYSSLTTFSSTLSTFSPTTTKKLSKSSSKNDKIPVPNNNQNSMATKDDLVKGDVLKALGEADFILETPTAAILSLTVGALTVATLCLFIICRCRGIKYSRPRKRNLPSDGDGDYLVNGLYL